MVDVNVKGTLYGIGKFAVRAISEGLRQEVKDNNVRVTVISPDAVDTKLTSHISEPELGYQVRGFVKDIAVPASTMSDTVAFAISQPEIVDVNEILFRSTVQPV